ncbi:MAG: polysaccharide deacetylase family protein [Brumimicrobium sp.]|nr:polysaccharide deacetylase family protein [Brumimicrobium sp.]
MNLLLTFDYELFFGKPTGTVSRCILQPTKRLIALGQKHNVKFTFFIDIGFIMRLEALKDKFKALNEDYLQITAQIKELINNGHDLQLHIHPHWDYAHFNGENWEIDLDGHYKLADFDEAESSSIIKRYKIALEKLTGKKITGFRAGGWCLQPFSQFYTTFKEAGIKKDSTVFPGAKLESKHYYFDFRNAPTKGRYFFEDDLCMENKDGYFLELPIGGYKYHPLFFWRLYALGRLFPSRHKMAGDGNFIAQPGKKFTSLKKSTWDHVSCDGYYAQKLNTITNKFHSKGRSDLVIIGHPKSMTLFSLEKLDEYIGLQKNKHSFITLSEA